MPLNWNFPAKIGPKTGKQVTMARKRYKPEEIVAKLRLKQVEDSYTK
jgi:hypothetical protein